MTSTTQSRFAEPIYRRNGTSLCRYGHSDLLVTFDGESEADEAVDILNDPRLDKFTRTALEVGFLVRVKNRKYGDSFSKAAEYIRLLYPNGIRPDQYDIVLCQLRQFDKDMRLATSPDAFGEDPSRDKLGYDILAVTSKLERTEKRMADSGLVGG